MQKDKIDHKTATCLPLGLQFVALPSVLSGGVITNDVDASYYSNKVSGSTVLH